MVTEQTPSPFSAVMFSKYNYYAVLSCIDGSIGSQMESSGWLYELEHMECVHKHKIDW